MNSQFHTPSLFDDVIFLGESIPDDSQQHQQQQQYQPQQPEQQHSQRIRGMDQAYNDYTNNAAQSYNPIDQQQQQQQLLSHHQMNPHHLQQQQQQQQQQQHMSMQSGVRLMNNQMVQSPAAMAGGLQTLAARKQMTPATADPNKLSKPLSAYALFFRDTVSVIKQQNSNGSFQELSRIVLSMWEALDEATKDIYTKKHDLACLEYYKHESALINNASQQQQQQQQQQFVANSTQYVGGDNAMVGSGPSMGNNNALQTKPAVFTIPRYANELGTSLVSSTTSPVAPSSASSSPSMGGAQMGNNNPYNNMTGMVGQQQQQQQQQMQQQGVHSTIGMDAAGVNDCYNVNTMMSDMMPQQHSLMAHQQQQQQQQQQEQQQQQHPQQQLPSNTLNARPNVLSDNNTLEIPDSPSDAASTQQMLTEAGSVQKCTRESCTQMAIINPDWEDEYCSNECVVLHCRNVFNGWIKSNIEDRQRKEIKN